MTATTVSATNPALAAALAAIDAASVDARDRLAREVRGLKAAVSTAETTFSARPTRHEVDQADAKADPLSDAAWSAIERGFRAVETAADAAVETAVIVSRLREKGEDQVTAKRVALAYQITSGAVSQRDLAGRTIRVLRAKHASTPAIERRALSVASGNGDRAALVKSLKSGEVAGILDALAAPKPVKATASNPVADLLRALDRFADSYAMTEVTADAITALIDSLA